MSKINCGIGDCPFSHELARVVGRHRLWAHGVRGASRSAVAKRSIGNLQAVASPAVVVEEKHKKQKKLKCQFCGKSYSTQSGIYYHVKHEHPDELRLKKLKIIKSEPLNGTVRQKTQAKPVSLAEAIQVLQVEADTLAGVIARLRQLQGS